ncbi:MAG: hypothetical protein V2G41_09975 [bacterium JZ-2024 1]
MDKERRDGSISFPNSQPGGGTSPPGPLRAGAYGVVPVQAPNLRQSLEHVYETRYIYDITLTLNATPHFDSYPTAVEHVTAPLGFIINYLQISPSMRGNDVLVSIDSTIQWREVAVETGAFEFFANADYVVRGGDSTKEYILPARKSVTLYATIFIPPQTPGNSNYVDSARIIVGFRRHA